MQLFQLAEVDEVHLDRAPLAKVLMQVQFSRTPQLVSDSAEAGIADALGRYPVRRRQFGVAPAVALNGHPLELAGAAVSVLTFADTTGAWQVTVAENAVSLETSSYDSRDDFCARALEVLQAVASVALPPVVDRVGMRYINRLTGDGLGMVGQYVAPQMQVLCDAVAAPLVVQHSVSDSLIEISPTERLQVRAGLLPSNVGFDPSLAAPAEPSWVLDVDVYTVQGGLAFDPVELETRFRRYAEASYAFFRFATTDAFADAHRDASPVTGEVG